ncbi:hypothetical protein PV11_09610 [Exophiala sideris]|uniref:RapZ C-terminal domain-containing protein n=1 Tax=Exophiala sideris TaxID=1016849 RepID=A0A0D1VP54_9EURO|nr:hypothetical protein PV11_09610 [Exophiala sideris]
MFDSIDDERDQRHDNVSNRNKNKNRLADKALKAVNNFHEQAMDDIKDYHDTDDDDNNDNKNDKNGNNNYDTKDKSPTFKLSIISYGSTFGRLEESPGDEHMDFSIADIPNPSAKIRKAHTGLSSELREAVMAEDLAPEWLNDITNEVQSKIAKMKSAHKKDPLSPTKLVIGLACGLGKHRSVTFAEELPRKLKTDGWTVTVHHRDISLNAEQAGSDEEDGSSAISTQTFDRKGMEKKNKDMREETKRRISSEGNDATTVAGADGGLDREGNEISALAWEK